MYVGAAGMGQIRGQSEGGAAGGEEKERKLHGDGDVGKWRMGLDVGVSRWVVDTDLASASEVIM